MFSYAVIAMTKEGKSKLVRETFLSGQMSQMPCLVFDVNDEYGAFRRDRDTGELKPSTNLPTDTSLPRSRFTGTGKGAFNKFVEIAQTKKYTTIVFEECTAFISGVTPEVIKSLIIAKGHTNNVFIFIYHSIRTIPPAMLDLMDTVYLFKTADHEKAVQDKNPKLLPYWYVLQHKETGKYTPFKIEWQREAFNPDFYKRLKNTKNGNR